MNQKGESEGSIILVYAVIGVIVFGLCFGISWTMSGFESRAYERATGKKVSQWDAMFLELRVQGC